MSKILSSYQERGGCSDPCGESSRRASNERSVHMSQEDWKGKDHALV